MNDIQPVRSYHIITGCCFVLHLILNIPLYLERKKIKINKFETERGIAQRSHSNGMDFGGVKTAWVCIIPLILQLIFLRLQSHQTPEMLNDYPNYWVFYFTQMFNAALFASLLVIVCYSKSNLRRALFNFFLNFIVSKSPIVISEKM